MPSIVAYHPSVNVSLPDGSAWVLTGDLPDWTSDEEFLDHLKAVLGVQDLHSLVSKVRSGVVVAGVNNLRVSRVG